jgi:hypothetical protein
MHEEAVGHLAHHLGHLRAHSGTPDARQAVGVGARIEDGGHQGVGVEVAAEVEPGPLLPAAPDGADRLDHLTHARRRPRPRHREAPLDVGLDLGTEAQDEASLGEQLHVVAQVGE